MAMQLGGGDGSSKKKGSSFSANSDINVTPFVDVMLVLLIIFMVAIPMAAVNIKVRYPDSNARADIKPPVTIYVSMPNGGGIYVQDTRYSSVSEVGDQLEKETPPIKRDKMRVLIRADANLPYRNVLDMLNRLRDGGFYKVALIGRPTIMGRPDTTNNQ